jgi:hypothetical protein
LKLLPSRETKPEKSLACVDAAQELFVTYPYKFSPKGIGMTSYSMLAGEAYSKIKHRVEALDAGERRGILWDWVMKRKRHSNGIRERWSSREGGLKRR